MLHAAPHNVVKTKRLDSNEGNCSVDLKGTSVNLPKLIASIDAYDDETAVEQKFKQSWVQHLLKISTTYHLKFLPLLRLPSPDLSSIS